MIDRKIVLPESLVDFIEDAADLTSEELGQAFRLAMKKVQYERGEVHCEGYNGEIEHENRLVKFAAITLFNGISFAR
jgi:hypothetical protein